MNKVLYLVLAIVQFLAVLAAFLNKELLFLTYYVSLLTMVALVGLAISGKYPFNKVGQIRYRSAWMLIGLLTIVGIFGMANSPENLFWYPTNNSLWSLAPLVLLLLFSWYKGIFSWAPSQ